MPLRGMRVAGDPRAEAVIGRLAIIRMDEIEEQAASIVSRLTETCFDIVADGEDPPLGIEWAAYVGRSTVDALRPLAPMNGRKTCLHQLD